ncbi:MAG: NAD(P)H dehydrogenase (quinone) [Bryobacteraceae bacterium]|nr:MAG: NAD(P)H dehydrogenase (quinone) [Bryobacteraceae bacterium]
MTRGILILLFLCPLWGADGVRILIAYYSETGHTAALAEAVREGAARVARVQALARRVSEVSDEEIRAAHGVLIGTPVHWQTQAAAVKSFLDRMGRVLGPEFGEGRTGGVFVTSGSPSNGADLARLDVIAALLSLRFVVAGGVIEGGYGSLGAQAFGEVTPVAREDARRFGERFARLTAKMRGVAR